MFLTNRSFPVSISFFILVFFLGIVVTPLWASPTDIRINEINFHPAGNDQALEFVELINTGPDAVDLSNWSFSKGIVFTFPNHTTLQAGNYLIIAKDTALAQSLYGDINITGNFSGSLSDSGEWLQLVDSNGMIIDEAKWSDSNAWPGKADGRGASLEKLLPRGEGAWGDAWDSSPVVNGTPGRVNSSYRTFEDQTLVGRGENWKYLKGTAEPPADWKDPGFDDSLWAEGPAGFGYGDDDDSTILDDMHNNYSTVYIRKTFTVQDKNFADLLLDIIFDDGFVAYLNGHEITRYFAPGNPGDLVPFDSLATDLHEATTGPNIFNVTNHLDYLNDGENVLAIIGINQSLTSSDLSLDPVLYGKKEVLGIDDAFGRRIEESLVPVGATWRYFKGTEEPPADWFNTAFTVDDSWLEGPTGIGYGDGDDATILDDMRNAYSTVYLRHLFDFEEDPGTIESLKLQVDYDDGFVAYLNGIEIARSDNVIGNPPLFNAFAVPNHEAGNPVTFDITARLDLLQQGENCLAINVINTTLNSSDLSMIPKLVATKIVRARPEALSCPVEINEVSPTLLNPGWIELYNGGDESWDISGYRLTTTPREPRLYSIPADTTLAPGEFFVVTEADFGRPIPSSGAILFTDPEGIILVDGREYEIDPTTGGTCSRYPDGKGNFKVTLTPTPGSANEPPPQWGIVINEIMYNPDCPPGEIQSEWIELLNTGPETVDLTGWKFTRGIDYVIPQGISIPAGGFLVIARNPTQVETEYGISNVIGGYSSGLKNDDEKITLRDTYNNIVDVVHYADDGRWPTGPDGNGPSLELVNPGYDNATGQAWAASSGSGTPGQENSVLSSEVKPLVRMVKHYPAVPTSTDQVFITCAVSCPTSGIANVELGWHIDGETDFTIVDMADDGAHGDGQALDGIYGGVINPLPEGTIVCFYISATTDAGMSQTVPAGWESDNSITMLYQVQNGLDFMDIPTYRIIMTKARQTELQTRDLFSDVLLDATFISGKRIYYNVGIRYRGKSCRNRTPKSYRIQFPDDEEFLDVKRLNLNGYLPWNQHLGMNLFRMTNVPAPASRITRVVFNNSAITPYVHMEAVHKGFLKRNFEGDDEGNLYRGEEHADLDYRGADKEDYRSNYQKRTNKDLDDFSDIIELCDKFSNTPDETFAQEISTLIDPAEWARFFAVHTIISTQEGGIYRDRGDDYYLYRRPSDNKFIIIPWDVDDSFTNSSEKLFRPTLPAIRRLLENPEFTPLYYSTLRNLTGGHFTPEAMESSLSDLLPYISNATENSLRTFFDERRSFVDQNIPTGLTVEFKPYPIVRLDETWKFFRGLSEPSGGNLDWATLDFSDDAWEEGQGGFGYGDDDDNTVLNDMRNNYSTVYIRRKFVVDDPASLPILLLTVDFDDGFIAYLNGTEIARSNVGEPGVPAPFDAVATSDHEAGVAATFLINNPESILNAGENILAIQGVNVQLDSSDLSLAPTLGLGSVVGEGCAGTVYVSGSELIVTGVASVADTKRVLLNGVETSFDYITGEFSANLPITTGDIAVEVQALRADDSVYASQDFNLSGVTSLGGAIDHDTTLDGSGSPYLIGGTLTVPAGYTLTIGPGVEFIMDEGGSIIVKGCIKAIGTEEEPIIFNRKPCISNWGDISLQQTREDNRFVWCEIHYGSAVGSSPGGITARSSKVYIDSCLITHINGEGLYSSSSDVEMRNSEISHTHEGVSADWDRPAVFEYNHIHNLIGKADCIDANGCNNPPAYAAYNILGGTSDDGFDIDNGSIHAVSNEISHCGDQAISLVGSGTSIVELNILHHCNYGVAVKNSHRATIDHNTIVDMNIAGIRCYEKSSGRGGGHATITNSIVYFNPETYTADEKSTISFDYSCVDLDPLPEGERNFNEDPMFVDRASTNYELDILSTCIGAGENGTDVGALPYLGAPVAPAELHVVGTTPESIDLTWLDTSVNEDGFELQRKAPGELEFSLLATLSANETTYTDEGLVDGETYVYRIRSFNNEGYSDWSNEVSHETGTIPQAPSNLVILSFGMDWISIMWQDNSDTEDSFEIYRLAPAETEFSLFATVNADITEYVDNDPPLLNGELYSYKVRAKNANGYSGWSNEISKKTGIPPDNPSGLAVTGYDLNTISIAWTDNSGNETGFNVEIQTEPEGPWHSQILNADITAYTAEGLEQDHLYSFRVRAENSSGVSEWTTPVTQKTAAIPTIPTDFSITDKGLDWALLAWQNSENETGYEIERKTGDGDFSPLVTLPANTTSYANTGLVSDTEYLYRIRAVNDFGSSEWSDTITAVTGKIPNTPTSLHVTDYRLTWIALSWEDTSDNESAFDLQRRQGNGAWTTIISFPSDWTSYTDPNLASGIEYSYRIRTLNQFGYSEWSSEISQTTGKLPQAPSQLEIIESGLDYLDLSWTDNSDDEIYFEMEKRTEGDSSWSRIGTVSPDITVFLDQDLPEGQVFFYRVRAWNEFGPSIYSNEAHMATGTLPAQPTGLSETSWSTSAIELQWNDNSDDETGFVIERSTGGGGNFELATKLPADTITWTDNEVVEDTVYSYRISAENDFGSSGPGEVLTTYTGIKILTVSPENGRMSGGTPVIIQGIHFSDSTIVKIGEKEITNADLLNNSQIAGITPPVDIAGTVPVTVEDGESSDVLPDGFNYSLGLLRGDANGNNSRSIADAIMILDYLFRNGRGFYCEDLADANNDGWINLGDAIYLLDYLFNNGPRPTPDHFDCGL